MADIHREDVMIRRFNKTDDIEKVAHLIYHTDLPLFTFLFGNTVKAIPKLKKLILLDHNAFSYRYIHCSIDKEIRGILIGYQQQELSKKGEYEDFSKVFSGFELFILFCKYLLLSPILKKAARDQFYIQNISIDTAFRGKGIGSSLLKYIHQYAQKQGVDTLVLDVTLSNDGARRLYEKTGFIRVHKYVYPFTQRGVFRMEKTVLNNTISSAYS